MRELDESSKMETQMMVSQRGTGASIRNIKSWKTHNWSGAWIMVRRRQMSIAKATLDGRKERVNALHCIPPRSYYAKGLAVTRRLFGNINLFRKNKNGTCSILIKYLIYLKGEQSHRASQPLKTELLEMFREIRIIMNPGYSTRLTLQNA